MKIHKKIPFTLEKYLKGGYKLKRGDSDARIVGLNVDRKDYPITVLYEDHGVEFIGRYTLKGEFISGFTSKDGNLFLVK